MILMKTGQNNRNRKALALCFTWTLMFAQGPGLSVLAQDLSVDNPQPINKVRFIINSDPSGQSIILDGKRLDVKTPARLDLNPGHYFIVVNAESYQPLSHDLAGAAGEMMEFDFILIKTPPEPPTPEELRALSPPFGAGDPNSDYWADAGPRHMANESCGDCHSPILTLHAVGEHRTLSCEDCHSTMSDHVKDGKVIGVSSVVRGDGIQNLCMMCHDRNNRNRTREPARTVDLRRHLKELRVASDNRCQECHHVHDPMKWVHEAREIVGIPEKMARIPMLDEKAAHEKRQQFNSMAETFFVFPLIPGAIGMATQGNAEEFPSKTLLISGLVLIAGCYVLGGKAYSRELNSIRALNDERKAVNEKVKEHNLRVEEAMEAYYEAITLWNTESEGRGLVNVKLH